MSVPTQVWLQKLITGSAARDFQSKSARRLLQLACRSRGVELNAGHLSLPGPALISLVERDFGLGISLSHCPQLVAVAIGKGRLGLDCEAMGKIRNWQALADHFFSQEEAGTIATSSAEEQERSFLRHWVLKESYIKSIRGTVFGDLNRLTLTDRGESAQVECDEEHKGGWAWVGSFSKCVLGMYNSPSNSPELEFYDATSEAGAFSRLNNKEVPGSFVPVTCYPRRPLL